MSVSTDPGALLRVPRAATLGTFDGVHCGHRGLVARAYRTGLVPTVVTFDPHPRRVLGRAVSLITALDRRLELLADIRAADGPVEVRVAAPVAVRCPVRLRVELPCDAATSQPGPSRLRRLSHPFVYGIAS